MRTLQHLIIDLVIFISIIATVFFLYQTYSERVTNYFFGEQKVGIFVRDVQLSVTVADTNEERQRGLSGVASLGDHEGMLFVFDHVDRHGFWMKDMLIPLDIIWIDNNAKVVHIEENVQPDSYPTIYSSPVPARFVLETNAFFVSTFSIKVGDKVTIPTHRLPEDLR